ncbi:MAG: DUF6308 family protein [Chloroflexota bacterium]|nr:DUF6308 family protein [Chloroflexota bacterium]
MLAKPNVSPDEQVIVLPEGTHHARRVIDRCRWRLKSFIENDAYLLYDHLGVPDGAPSNTILRHHLYSANAGMFARSSAVAWEAHLGRPLARLGDIPVDLDLIEDEDGPVDAGLECLRDLVREITGTKGITDMGASKMLHLTRPRFVAISDRYVRDRLAIDVPWPAGLDRADYCAARLVAVQRGMRALGKANAATLDQLTQYVNSLPPLTPGTEGQRMPGAYRANGKSIAVRLSKLRVLDIILWTDVALLGPTPNPSWKARFEQAFPA